jgi:hypothetical protein
MIATDRFVFLHLHKSGGTFVNECLLRFVPGARQLGYHLPRAMIPSELRQLPVLGVVRNPWSYYVSWYAFQAARPQPNPLFGVLSRNRELGFARRAPQLEQRDLERRSPALGGRPPAHKMRNVGRHADSGEGFIRSCSATCS